MSSWHSYPKIYNVGHAAVKDLFVAPVIVEEKIDGSQFSFGRFNGVLRCRSKGQELNIDAPEKMFAEAVDAAKELPLLDGYTYRAEYLKKPKHNSLAYGRIPVKHLIIFDICREEEDYLDPEVKAEEASRIGLEVVPVIYRGMIEGSNSLLKLLDRRSVLGGDRTIEGVVCKQYSIFGADKKMLFAKYVSEEFKEFHKKEWSVTNPTSSDIKLSLGDYYRSEARWAKAVQHLRERGEIADSPKDIGALFKEVKADIEIECKEEIKNKLYEWAIDSILRRSVQGIPDWYKKELAARQFGET